MNIFIKLAVFSFPFVFAAALFWPTIQEKKTSVLPSAFEEDPLLRPSPIIDNYKSQIHSKNSAKQNKTEPLVEPTESNIYRWVDEKGQIHFSDTPSHKNAVSYTPGSIGYVSVSDDIKRSVAADEYRVGKRAKELIASASEAQTKRMVSRQQATSFKFTNTDAGQKHGYVLMSGRVSGGSACRQLRVTVHARSDEGSIVSGYDDVRVSGSGSRLFEIKARSRWNGGGERRPQWEIMSLTASCLRQ